MTNRRKVGMTSSHHGPYGLGYTRATMVGTEGCKPARGANLTKPVVVRIESATRLREVGIASNRRSECCGEYVPGPCTHRPSHHGSGCTEVGSLTFGRALTTVIHDWGEVVTR